MRFNRLELLILPTLLFIFFVTYHYYGYYNDDFKKVFQFVAPTLSKNQYEEIQGLHPYTTIHKLARTVKEPEENIIYVASRYTHENEEFLHELTIMIDYFFYPHIISRFNPLEFSKMELTEGQIVIADFNPKDFFPKDTSFKPIMFPGNQLVRINRHPEDPYYIFEVIK